jgi:hypothetical protein
MKVCLHNKVSEQDGIYRSYAHISEFEIICAGLVWSHASSRERRLQEHHMLFLVMGDEFEVGIVLFVEAGVYERLLGERGESLFVEDVFQMLELGRGSAWGIRGIGKGRTVKANCRMVVSMSVYSLFSTGRATIWRASNAPAARERNFMMKGRT